MKPKERYRKIFNGELPDRVPFTEWIDKGIEAKLMDILGEGPDYDAVTVARRLHMDALYTWGNFAPIFCKKVEISDKTGECIENEHLGDGFIKTIKDLDKMQFPDPYDPAYYDDWKRYIDRYGKTDYAICFFTRNIGPFETIFSLGLHTFAKAQFRDKKLLAAVMDKYVEWDSVVFDKLQEYAGDALDFMILASDMAFSTGTVVLPDIFDEIFVPRSKEIAKHITVPWVFHTDGFVEDRIMKSILDIGPVGFNPVDPNCMDIFEVREKYKDIVLWGNLDVNTLAHGTEEETRQQTRTLVEKIGKKGRYIFATGNSVPDWANPYNVIAMCDEYNKCADL